MNARSLFQNIRGMVAQSVKEGLMRINKLRLTVDKRLAPLTQIAFGNFFIRKTLSGMPKPFHKKIAIGGDKYGI